MNLVEANKSLYAKIQHLQAKLARNKPSIMSNKESRRKISKKVVSVNGTVVYYFYHIYCFRLNFVAKPILKGS
uniref:Uncharacterized protein n=1 Tax=Lepeophtheirus salmonis TaxID=72036 RepID=A0A0K2T8T3_LEPSM